MFLHISILKVSTSFLVPWLTCKSGRFSFPLVMGCDTPRWLTVLTLGQCVPISGSQGCSHRCRYEGRTGRPQEWYRMDGLHVSSQGPPGSTGQCEFQPDTGCSEFPLVCTCRVPFCPSLPLHAIQLWGYICLLFKDIHVSIKHILNEPHGGDWLVSHQIVSFFLQGTQLGYISQSPLDWALGTAVWAGVRVSLTSVNLLCSAPGTFSQLPRLPSRGRGYSGGQWSHKVEGGVSDWGGQQPLPTHTYCQIGKSIQILARARDKHHIVHLLKLWVFISFRI